MKILILAGGQGARLWPISRKQKPKQFQKLLGAKTMLQETVERVLPAFSCKDIFISTNKEYLKEVVSELPRIPFQNIIIEPERRERAAAISLFLTKSRENEPILVLPSDHLIKDKQGFLKAILTGKKFIEKNKKFILALGHKPTFPDTGLGYLKKGELLFASGNAKIYNVSHFKEKPNLKTARIYSKSKNYFWNMGIYLFYPALMENLLKEFVSDNYKRYLKIKQAQNSAEFKKILHSEYAKMDVVSLEYSVIENYPNIALLPLDIGWSDIGSWAVLKDALCSPGKNFVKGNYIGINSKDIMVYGSQSRLVASVGVKNLVIVVTDDIIFICHRNSSQKVRELIKKMEKEKDFDKYI